jgi:predicted acylesterase/phospholipase RssA
LNDTTYEPPRPGKELRLAVAMRGGVSLAVWIGGALAEIDALRRAAADSSLHDPKSLTYRRLLHDAGYSTVRVDVLSGTSAGGLNGAIYAACLLYDIDFSQMRDIWVELADLEKMFRTTTVEKSKPVDSLLRGDDYFLEQLVATLKSLKPRSGDGGEPTQDYMDLVLTGTLFEPIKEPLVGAVDGSFDAVRSAAFFHFHHEEGNSHFEHLSDARTDGGVLAKLALAGRTSSSYPFAFEPATVMSQASAAGSGAPNMVGIFSETGKSFRVMDGGVLDNIPIARAIDAIAGSPAATPTQRWLLYLYPSPPDLPEPTASPPELKEPTASPPEPKEPTTAADGGQSNGKKQARALTTVVRALSAIVGIETVRDDVVVLERHNREVEFQAVRWRSLWEGVTRNSLTQSDDATFAKNRADLDGRRMRTMLELPAQYFAGRPQAIAAAGYKGLGALAGPDARTCGKTFQDRVQAIYAGNVSILKTDAQTLLFAVDLLIGACREIETIGSPAQRSSAGPTKHNLYTYRRELSAALIARDVSLLQAISASGSSSQAQQQIADLTIEQLSASSPAGQIGPHFSAVAALLRDVPAVQHPWSLLARSDATEEHLLAMARRSVAMNASALQNSAPLALKIISGAEPTPLAPLFKRYPTVDGELAPRVKLAGNELANFAAFLDPRWRVNDWAWGRADAAARLIRSLDEQRQGQPRNSDVVDNDVLAVQRIIWEEELKPMSTLPDGPSSTATLEEQLATYGVGLEGPRSLSETYRARLAMRTAKIGVAAVLPVKRLPRLGVQLVRPIVYAAAFALAAGRLAAIGASIYACSLAIWWHRSLAGWGWQKHLPLGLLFVVSAPWLLSSWVRARTSNTSNKSDKTNKPNKKVSNAALAAFGVATVGLLLTSIPEAVFDMKRDTFTDSTYLALLPDRPMAWLVWPGLIVIAATVLAAVGAFWMRALHRVIAIVLTPVLYVGVGVVLKSIDRQSFSGWSSATAWEGFPLGWWIVASLVATSLALAGHVTKFDVFPPVGERDPSA